MTVPPAGLAQPASRGATGELLISMLLRFGLVASVSVILAGMAVSFAHHPEYLTSAMETGRLTASGDAPHSLAGVWTGLLALRGRAVVMLGLLLLICVPVARVLLSLFIFGYRRNRAFLVITAVVSGLLLVSFLVGKVSE